MIARRHFIERVAAQKGYKVTEIGTVISPFSNTARDLIYNNGYYYFTVRTPENKTVNCWVHRLQAYQKFGEQIYGAGIQVRHLNGDSEDNSAVNIAIGTQSDNMMDRPKEDRVRIAGAANRKFDSKAVKAYYDTCRSYKQTMLAFGLKSKGTLHYILNTREAAASTAEQAA